jgi:sulfite reductase beta subunit-like hemoprotein
MKEKTSLEMQKTEEVPRFQINVRSLTSRELDVVAAFLGRPAMTAYEAYSQIVFEQFLSVVKNPNRQAFKIAVSKYGVERLASHLNSKYKTSIAAFNTIRDICDDFHKVGWLSDRKDGEKTLFYMEESTEKIIMSHPYFSSHTPSSHR